MKEWICKNCKSNDIIRRASGRTKMIQKHFDQYGVPDEFELFDFEAVDTFEYECVGCGDSSYDIQDIATYVEVE